MNRLELKLPPPLVMLLMGVAMWGLARAFPQTYIAVPLWAVLLPAALGAIVSALGVLGMGRTGTTLDPLKPAKATVLVTGGIYRVTRNPMYLGLALLLLGWALWLGIDMTLLGPALFVLYITRFQILPEERALFGLFGKDYRDYTTHTRRWV
jgi:protein-S-isoprenylcysteine O-methyltransferase Ste14